jgi:hypothetical protein
MAGSDREQHPPKPSEQRGGTTLSEAEDRAKGEWAGTSRKGIVPAEQGGSDARCWDDDPELDSSVLGETTGSDEPATESGINPRAGDDADAGTDGGVAPAGASGARHEGHWRRAAQARRRVRVLSSSP